MKKPVITVVFILYILCSFNCVSRNQDSLSDITFIKERFYFILKLPYDTGGECTAVFSEDTPAAIDILELVADGKKLQFIMDITTEEGRSAWTINAITPGINKYYILMQWDKGVYENLLDNSFTTIRWNDGRGLIFTDTGNGSYKISTNTYELVKGMQTVYLKYRIRLPDKGMPRKGNYPLRLKENNFSKIYTYRLNLKSLWNDE